MPLYKNYFNSISPSLSSLWVKAFIVITLTFPVVIFAGGSPLKVSISAKNAVLMNAQTGAILYEKRGKEPSYPASTTKLITALYALEKKGSDLDVMIRVSPDAVATVSKTVRRTKGHPPYRLEFGGTHMSLQKGEELSLKTLLYGLMLASANDAANVIAEYVSGSCENFMQELNAYVRSKGCLNTTLYNPHGLPHPDHKTTAYDLAKLMQAALQVPDLLTLMRTIHYTRPAYGIIPESSMVQHNALIKPGKFYHPKVLGGKTGYTEWGGYTLVAAAEDADRKLIVALLGCDKIENRYRDAIALFDAAFHEKKVERVLLSSAFETFQTELPGAKNTIEAHLENDLKLAYYPSEEPEVSIQVSWNPLSLPIEKGTAVGHVSILSQSKTLLARESLLATKRVESTWSHTFYQSFKAMGETTKRNRPIIFALIGTLLITTTFYLYSFRRKVSL